MKRVYLILTLFITSFFFISLNKVSADTIDLTISQDMIDLLSSTDFMTLRDYNLENLESDNMYYLLYYSKSNSKFFSHHFESYEGNYIMDSNVLKFSPGVISSFYRVVLNNKVYQYAYSGSGATASATIDIDNNTIDYILLDTNYPDFKYNGTDEYNFIYDTCTYSLKNGSRVRGLYDYYVANQNSCILEGEESEDIYSEEKEIMNNFYLTIFTKISDLATSLANNYIFLIIFGIFILIFVLELIRRYLL